MKIVMKKLAAITFIGLLMHLAFISSSAQEKVCVLKGEVIDRKSKVLHLNKFTEDLRISTTNIPINNGYFEYELKFEDVEAYVLVFKEEHDRGNWIPITFFPDSEVINFTLYPEEKFEENKIKGGEVNEAYANYSNEFYGTFRSGFMEISDQLEKHKADKEQVMVYREQMNQLQTEAIAWRYQYIHNNVSISSYLLILQDLLGIEYNRVDVQNIKAVFPSYAEKFPNHIYTTKVGDALNSLDQIKVGGRYIDFTAEDLQKKEHIFSKLKNDNIVLLDLWASWCGPCIAKSRTMVPIYQEYKNKGFDIIGVAREAKDTKKMEDRIKKEKWTWLNLVDLDDKYGIWPKYNLSFAGGGVFLIDRDGSILAVNPDADEVKKILEEKL
jgi:thiol-disulfide isomerase/thioredoxin